MENDEDRDQERERKIKQLARIVCICKGIPLSKILPALSTCDTVEEVNRCAGTGTGGCAGQRCGPRIRTLIDKKKKSQS